jgi:RimJ/RimL family protein N-acetyltransferase
VFLKGERVGLRPPRRESIESYLSWFNDLDILQYVLRVRPMSRAEEEEWLDNLPKRPDDVVFEIASLESGASIGACGLHRISGSNRSAELGITIGEKSLWGRGLGREVLGLLCRYGFDVLNLNRIGLSVYAYNERAIRCYERVGFKLEGRRRSARFWNGKYWDILEMGILESEWRSAREPGPSDRCQAEVETREKTEARSA